MQHNLRKLSTNDVLVYDDQTTEAYVIQPRFISNKSHADKDLVTLARELVANGHGIHLSASQMNKLKSATTHVELLT